MLSSIFDYVQKNSFTFSKYVVLRILAEHSCVTYQIFKLFYTNLMCNVYYLCFYYFCLCMKIRLHDCLMKVEKVNRT